METLLFLACALWALSTLIISLSLLGRNVRERAEEEAERAELERVLQSKPHLRSMLADPEAEPAPKARSIRGLGLPLGGSV